MSRTNDEQKESHLFWSDALRAYRFPAILLPIALFAISTWGVYDGIHDPRGDRPWGMFVVYSPAILAACWGISIAFRREVEAIGILVRMVTSSLLVTIPLVVVNVIGKLAVWLVPGNQDVIAHAGGRRQHYYWDEGIIDELLLTALGGYFLGGAIGILAFLAVTLPLVALRVPGAVTFGSHMERIGNPRVRDNTALQVFGGLSLFILGLIGTIMMDYTNVGIALICLGVLFMAIASMRTLVARFKTRKEYREFSDAMNEALAQKSDDD